MGVAHGQRQAEGDQQQDGSGAVYRCCVHRVQHAAERRSADDGCLHAAGGQGDGAQQQGGWNELRGQRLLCRLLERAGDAEYDRDAEHQPARGEAAGDGGEQQ